MSQPIPFITEHLGSIEAIAGQEYTTASILTEWADATIVIMKTRAKISDPIKVSVDGYPAFELEFGEFSHVVTGKTYTFTKNCTIAVCKYVSGV